MDFDFGGEHADRKNIPTQFHNLYEDKEGGGLQLKSDDTVKGAVEAIIGLNKALRSERDAHTTTKGKKKVDLSILSDFGGSPDEIAATFQTQLEELQGKVKNGSDVKIEVEKALKDRDAAHSTVVGAKDEKITTLLGQLKSVLIDGQIMSAIGGLANDPDLLLPFVQKRVAPIEEDGQIKVVVVDDQKNRRFSTTGGDLTISELVAEMKADEKFGVFFKSEAPNGSSHRPGAGSRMPPASNVPKSSAQKISDGLTARATARS